MYYMFLICDSETGGDLDSPDFQKIVDGFQAVEDEFRERGMPLHSGGKLASVSTATTVRVRDGKIHTTDGPFAETKEMLGGFLIVDCTDLDAAIEYASKIPVAEWGSVEVRPMEMLNGEMLT